MYTDETCNFVTVWSSWIVKLTMKNNNELGADMPYNRNYTMHIIITVVDLIIFWGFFERELLADGSVYMHRSYNARIKKKKIEKR